MQKLVLFFIIQIIYSSICLGFTNLQQKTPSKEELAKATTLFKQKKFEEAEIIYTTYLKQNGSRISQDTKVSIYNQLLKVYTALRDFEKGIKIKEIILEKINQIESHSSKRFEVYFSIGEFYRKKWDAQEAITAYKKNLF